MSTAISHPILLIIKLLYINILAPKIVNQLGSVANLFTFSLSLTQTIIIKQINYVAQQRLLIVDLNTYKNSN